MITKDRKLLARLATVNRNLGEVVIDLMQHQDGGELPADRLADMATALFTLAIDMASRAEELDGGGAGRVVEGGDGGW
ncbi:hypothetical protein [Saccharomonospora halophila]|uniref:hypothetical protein n=1 Tax=Saccharomonospora halophila TaxID=129922 RepID=UPI00036BDE46|nr:hypothetical protein [Saccharomonospora halophila]